MVLRLLRVEGSDGARDGHVTYHVEALESPGHLFRLPTATGPVWIKAIPPFAAAEPAAIAAIATVDPELVPTMLASAPGRLLLADIPGADCWDASPPVVAEVVRRLVTAQARIDQPPQDLPDRRPQMLCAAVKALLDGPVGAELSAEELKAATGLQRRWEMLADCALPDTVVHGDFHPGNWRCGDGPPVVHRSRISPTPCDTRSSSTTSNPASASTTLATRPR